MKLEIKLTNHSELRLMKKAGFYLAGVGGCFFVSGVLAAGNPVLLLIGNLLFIAG